MDNNGNRGFKKVLLVNLYYKESGYGERLNFPPVGLGYISQFLEKEGIEHAIIDTGAGYEHKDVLDKVNDFKPDLVGFSLNSICFPKSLDLMRETKKQFPQVSIVAGGPHISTRRDGVLKENDMVDYGIAREGEIPLALLCKGEDMSRIPGLIWRDSSGEVHCNEVEVSNIEGFPFPRFDKFDLQTRYDQGNISILTSRGCPFRCAFCQQSSLLGKNWRGRKNESVVEEIEYWHKRGFKSIHVLDDNFTFDKKRFFHIVDLLITKNLEGLKFSLIGGIRIQNTDEEILLKLKKIGVKKLSFGIESGSDKILKFIKKGISIADADRIVKMAVDMGFDVRLFFIIGFPYEKMEDVKKSFDFALKHKIREARFFNLVPYEGTAIMDWIKADSNAKLLYPYEEYMSNFKHFQRDPLFDSEKGMTLDEKKKALQMADDVVRKIEKRWPAD